MRPETCLNTHRSSQRQSSHIASYSILSQIIRDTPRNEGYSNYKITKTENFSQFPWFHGFPIKNMSRKSPTFPTLSNPLGRVVSPWPGRRLFPTLSILKTRRCLDDVPLSKTTCSLAAWLKLSQDSQTSEDAC